MPKMSIVVPVYYNAENLPPLYEDLKAKVLDAADFDIEVILSMTAAATTAIR